MMPEFLSTYKIKHVTVSFPESRNLWFFQSRSGIHFIDSAEQSAFNEATCLSLFFFFKLMCFGFFFFLDKATH